MALRELLPAELGGAEIETTSRELSRLAEILLERALAEAEAEVAARYGAPRLTGGGFSRLVVLGLGKLGGLELNAGSDIDVLFVYDTDEGESSLSLNQHWTHVVRRVVELVGAQSADGLLWRVDLRLRPRVAAGTARQLDERGRALLRARWGRFWERAALLRARATAGDRTLGELLERDIVTPFVYRREVDPSVAESLSDMLVRLRRELSADPKRDLKLGVGGIREAEFFVQTLQLVWGGREPSLRVKGIIAGSCAYARLPSRGLVSEGEASAISESYALLRKLEHRVQWQSDVQTHLLPTGDALARLARTMRVDERTLLGAVERARSTVHSHSLQLARAESHGDGFLVRARRERAHGRRRRAPDPGRRGLWRHRDRRAPRGARTAPRRSARRAHARALPGARARRARGARQLGGPRASRALFTGNSRAFFVARAVRSPRSRRIDWRCAGS